MLTWGDDYPIHQTAEPIAFAGTDRNFYDRYFFNGYSRDGSIFFACALGVYPHLNIMDGAFCVVLDGVQHNLRVSRHLGMERMDTCVGPLRIEVVEPLHKLRLIVTDNDHGITADILFTSRAAPVQEPRFTRRIGPRSYMDYTRLTQNGVYGGWIDVQGQRCTLHADAVWGTRDRSWGVRPVGQADSQKLVPPAPEQFCWIWAPLNFDDCFTLYHLNADEHGHPWNTAGVIGSLDGVNREHFAHCRVDIILKPNSRHMQKATLIYPDKSGGETVIELEPQWNFYMSGLGYLHPEWGHGMENGALTIGYDTLVPATIQSFALPYYLHIQAFSTAVMTLPNGQQRVGSGVLEQLIIGPYQPFGITTLLDAAP